MTEYVEPLSSKYSRIMIVAHGAINKAMMMHVKSIRSRSSGQAGCSRTAT